MNADRPPTRKLGRVLLAVALVIILVTAGLIYGPTVWYWARSPSSVDLSTVGLDALTATEIVRADGTRRPVELPPNRAIATNPAWPNPGPGARVAGGFLVSVDRGAGGVMPDGGPVPSGGPVPDGLAGPYANGVDGGAELWFVPDGAVKPRFIAFLAGSWGVSADGTVLVVTGVVLQGYLTTTAAIAYRLPDLTILKGPFNTSLTYQEGPPRVVGVTPTAAILQGLMAAGPTIGVWPLADGALKVRPGAYALDTSADGRVLVRDAYPRGFVPPAEGQGWPQEQGCLNLVSVDVVLSNAPVGAACAPTGQLTGEASVSPDGAWIVVANVFSDYQNPDDGDDQDNALVRSADLAAGRWAPTRQRPFDETSAVAYLPYAWPSNTTYVVEKRRYTFWSRLDPFGAQRLFAGFYLCDVDNSSCQPITMPDSAESTRPMAHYGP